MLSIIIYSVVAIIAIVILYQIYKFYNKRRIVYHQEKKVIKLVHDATQYKKIANKNIPTSKFSNEYSLSFWMHIDNYSYRFRKNKVVLRKGSEDGSEFNPEISLDPVENKLIVKIQIQSETVDTFNNVSNNRDNFQDVNSGSQSAIQSLPQPLSDNSDIPTVYSNISGNLVPNGGNGTTGNNGNNGTNNTITEHFYQDLGENFVNNNGDSGVEPTNMAVSSEGEVPNLGNQLKGFLEGSSDLLMEPFQGQADNEANNVPDANNDATTGNDEMVIPECNATEEDLIEIYYNIFLYLCSVMKDVSKPASVRKFIDDIHELVFKPIEVAIKNRDKSQLAVAQNQMTSYVQEELSRPPSQEEEKMMEYIVQHEIIKESCDLNSFDKDKIKKGIDDKLKQSNCPIRTQDGPGSIYNLIKNSVLTMFLNACDYVKENNPQIAEKLLSGRDRCLLKEVPLQKWVHIVVSVYNNTCDIYLDGKLGSSCVLKGFPQLNQGDLHVAPDGGFAGRLANVTAISMALNQDDVYAIYRRGPKLKKSLWDTIKGKFSSSS